jgi:DNA-binding NtrC family response regulator
VSNKTKILIVDDEDSFRIHLKRLFTRRGYDVAEAANGRAALELAQEHSLDLVLLDIVLPDIDGVEVLRSLKESCPEVQVIMITANATVNTAIASMRLGAYDYLIKPFEIEELTILIERAFELSALRRDSRLLQHELDRQRKFDDFVGHDDKTEAVRELVEKVAPTDSTVLITGETGTGKELIAKAVHRKSHRHRRPFIVLNCSAIQDTLLESEMFGYEKGAFTGAVQDKSGLIDVANTGSIFFDEVGELSPALQIKLLRFLENGEYRPVGSTRSRRADVRVVAATNRDLKALIQQEKFREDLFYRLNVINIQLSPLRDKKEDIPRLVEYFLQKICHKMGKCVKEIDVEALELLQHYHWPGNVRELENVLERATILASGDTITRKVLPPEFEPSYDLLTAFGSKPDSLRTVERGHILKVLQDTIGNKAEAARRLGITKKTLYAKLRAYGIHPGLS